MILKQTYISLIIGLFITACGQQSPEKEPKDIMPSKKDFIQANRHMVNEDESVIKRYLKRKGWEMKQTSSGLWYDIYEEGNGKKATKGKLVKINYEVRLLDGTLCYSSDEKGPKIFKIGKGHVEAGLEEGIRKLREGDKARFIMPPHLAHGLLGNKQGIPPSSIILYNIHVLKIKSLSK